MFPTLRDGVLWHVLFVMDPKVPHTTAALSLAKGMSEPKRLTSDGDGSSQSADPIGHCAFVNFSPRPIDSGGF